MVDAAPLRIFLASPGDVEAERLAVRACVSEQNDRSRGESNVVFEVIGWEEVRGTARRPQEAISELIRESHFLIVLLKGSWGNTPGSPWGYTSGTEEEFFTGLLELGQAEQPMRDVWVAFLHHSSPASQIGDLRRQIGERHAMLYEDIASVGKLKEWLTERLEAWEASVGPKIPRHIDLLPSSGKDVLKAQRLRLKGEKLVELGQPESGEAALKEAAAVGGPVEHLAYATRLARTGDHDGAHSETQRAIDYFTGALADLHSPIAAEAFAAQASVLRRQGHYVDAIGRFEQALTLIGEDDASGRPVRCRILDELGLANQKTGNLESARNAFQTSRDLRDGAGDDFGVSQSLVNLARLEVAAEDLETAAAYSDQALERLNGTPPTSLHANAEVLATQVRLRQGRPDEGLSHAERALSLNRQLGSKRNEAIALLVMAQCYRATGMFDAAAEHASACLELNQAMGNEDGARQAQWILDNLAG